MSNPTDPATRINALEAIDGVAGIEFRPTLSFLNSDLARSFIPGLVAQNALQMDGLMAATEAEMQAGAVSDLRTVSPLLVAQAIAALAPTDIAATLAGSAGSANVTTSGPHDTPITNQ